MPESDWDEAERDMAPEPGEGSGLAERSIALAIWLRLSPRLRF